MELAFDLYDHTTVSHKSPVHRAVSLPDAAPKEEQGGSSSLLVFLNYIFTGSIQRNS